MLLASVGPARLWCQVWYLQFRNCGLWAGQWQGAFPGHAPHPSNRNSSTQSASIGNMRCGVRDHAVLLSQMLLQKLRGAHCCLLDVAPYPLGELGGLKVSRSGVDSGIGESVATGSLLHSAPAAPAERPQSPGPKNHSTTLHNLVQLCLQQQPERRWFNDQARLGYWPFSQLMYKHFTTFCFKKLTLKMDCLSFIDRQHQRFWPTRSSSRWVKLLLSANFLFLHLVTMTRQQEKSLFSLNSETSCVGNVSVNIVAC